MTKLKLHTTISLPDTRNVYDKSLNDEEYPEAEHWMEDCTLQFLEFMIRTNDYCKDKDKEVNAASVVNVSEQETHGSQVAPTVRKRKKKEDLYKNFLEEKSVRESGRRLMRMGNKKQRGEVRGEEEVNEGKSDEKDSDLGKESQQIEMVRTEKERREREVEIWQKEKRKWEEWRREELERREKERREWEEKWKKEELERKKKEKREWEEKWRREEVEKRETGRGGKKGDGKKRVGRQEETQRCGKKREREERIGRGKEEGGRPT